MRAKIRQILEECIENGLQYGMMRAHKHTDAPDYDYLIDQMENAIWLEIDERFDFERNICDEVVKGFDHLEAKRNKCNDHPDAPHGMDRSASHNAGRYVCECESWEPEKREWVYLTGEEMLDIVDAYGMQLAEAIEAKLKDKNT